MSLKSDYFAKYGMLLQGCCERENSSIVASCIPLCGRIHAVTGVKGFVQVVNPSCVWICALECKSNGS